MLRLTASGMSNKTRVRLVGVMRRSNVSSVGHRRRSNRAKVFAKREQGKSTTQTPWQEEDMCEDQERMGIDRSYLPSSDTLLFFYLFLFMVGD